MGSATVGYEQEGSRVLADLTMWREERKGKSTSLLWKPWVTVFRSD